MQSIEESLQVLTINFDDIASLLDNSLPPVNTQSEPLEETLQVLTDNLDVIASLLDETFKDGDIDM